MLTRKENAIATMLGLAAVITTVVLAVMLVTLVPGQWAGLTTIAAGAAHIFMWTKIVVHYANSINEKEEGDA